MKNNNKKGFSLAEVLIVFLLVSTMLVAFAPLMTKKTARKVNPNCPSGIENKTIEYSIPDTYYFVTPENITGNATITLIGGGGNGGNANATYTYDSDAKRLEITYATGGGGGGGAYVVDDSILLSPNTEYKIIVGVGGTKNNHISDRDTIFEGGSLKKVAAGGQNASGETSDNEGEWIEGQGGQPRGENGYSGQNNKIVIVSGNIQSPNPFNIDVGRGGRNSSFQDGIESTGGIAGETCIGINSEADCNPHGKAGSGFDSFGGYAGQGGGGGGLKIIVTGSDDTSYNADIYKGFGGIGGSGYAKIEYQVRCEY